MIISLFKSETLIIFPAEYTDWSQKTLSIYLMLLQAEGHIPEFKKKSNLQRLEKCFVSQDIWVCWFSPLLALGWLHHIPSLGARICHTRSGLCIEFGSPWVSQSWLTWPQTMAYGVILQWFLASVLPHFFPDCRGQGKDTGLNNFLLLLGDKRSPKTVLWSLPQGNEQFLPWMVWANIGITKSLETLQCFKGGWFPVYLFQGVPIIN